MVLAYRNNAIGVRMYSFLSWERDGLCSKKKYHRTELDSMYKELVFFNWAICMKARWGYNVQKKSAQTKPKHKLVALATEHLTLRMCTWRGRYNLENEDGLRSKKNASRSRSRCDSLLQYFWMYNTKKLRREWYVQKKLSTTKPKRRYSPHWSSYVRLHRTISSSI